MLGSVFIVNLLFRLESFSSDFKGFTVPKWVHVSPNVLVTLSGQLLCDMEKGNQSLKVRKILTLWASQKIYGCRPRSSFNFTFKLLIQFVESWQTESTDWMWNWMVSWRSVLQFIRYSPHFLDLASSDYYMLHNEQ